MKMTIKIEYEIDGERPGDESICDALYEAFRSQVLCSEQAGEGDRWALIEHSRKIEIEEN